MVFLYDVELLNKRPGLFKYRANELLNFIKEFEMGEFYRKKVLDHLNNPVTHYLIKSIEDGKDLTENQIKSDPALRLAAYEYRIQQIESLIIELLRYQNWIAKPFQHDKSCV